MTQFNTGDGVSLFANSDGSAEDALISAQLDPSLPNVTGLTRVTDALVPMEHSSVRFRNFDPELYDLSDTSHLSKLLKALTGAAGAGGIRKQTMISRMSSALHGAHFLDLDSFYGALFNLARNVNEQMPVNDQGIQFDPLTDVTDADAWDDIQARDAQYRSRIVQFARAVNMGCTYPGLVAVAEAVVNAEVDIYESWVIADTIHTQQLSVPSVSLSWGAVKAQFGSFGNVNGLNYAYLEGNVAVASQTPGGNRGELIVAAHRQLSTDEKYQLAQVLRVLKPSHTQVTISDQSNQTYEPVAARAITADSENWTVSSVVSPNDALPTFVAEAVYPSVGRNSAMRPAFSQVYGEGWSYSPNVRAVESYQMLNSYQGDSVSDEEVVIYHDGSTHVFASQDAILDPQRAITARLSSDGIMVAYPYSADRSSR